MERNLPQKPPLQKRVFARTRLGQQTGEPATKALAASALRNPNLALFPFSALLPPLSEINELIGISDALKQRQFELLESKNATERNLSREQSAKRTAEEQMLNQVFQWLYVVQGKEAEDE